MTLQSEDMGKLVAEISAVPLPEQVQKFTPSLLSVKDLLAPALIVSIAEAVSRFRPAHREAQPETDGGGEVDYRSLLENLLARIHRDGGHHIEAVGWKQAAEEAEEIVAPLVQRSADGASGMALEPGVPWAGDDERWDDVRSHWRRRADEHSDDDGRIDLTEVDTCVAIALHRAFSLTLNGLSGPSEADTPLQAASREAGWALMEIVDLIPWEKRQHVQNICANLAVTVDVPTPEGQTEGALRSICQRMADDFQTSAIHHPNHILVSRTDFEAMVEALRLAALASKGV